MHRRLSPLLPNPKISTITKNTTTLQVCLIPLLVYLQQLRPDVCVSLCSPRPSQSPDQPIANTPILIVAGTKKASRATGPVVLGSETTDSVGMFSITVVDTGLELAVVKDNKNRDPLLTFSPTGEQLNIPVPRPANVSLVLSFPRICPGINLTLSLLRS